MAVFAAFVLSCSRKIGLQERTSGIITSDTSVPEGKAK
jgi:hypothetical protein